MKKAVFLVLLLAVFCGCLWLGYRVSIGTLPSIAGTPESAPSQSASQQINMLVVSIDSFDSPNPRLISAWVLFAVPADPSPSLVFLPVYTQDGRYANAAQLGGVFALTSAGKPTVEFEKAVLETIQLARFDQYVVLDTQAVSAFTSLVPGALPSPQPFQVAVPDDELMIRSLCAAFTNRDANTHLEMQWGQIVPEHFRTEMDFPTFTGNWNKFTQSTTVAHCEVLPNITKTN